MSESSDVAGLDLGLSTFTGCVSVSVRVSVSVNTSVSMSISVSGSVSVRALERVKCKKDRC